ncbi:hypothetical protein [Miltoncostaea oceani]|uniref:hypothetical protein n=1 Tax=Miltoncostaea oceani TaxID=2843216 RepID=UPI001C3CA183|nr:hypothetical protein [Miltoncostaea oceani]
MSSSRRHAPPSRTAATGSLPDRVLGPGIVVAVEPDGSEVVCAGRDQLSRHLEECRRRGRRPHLRWRDDDGRVVRSASPPGGVVAHGGSAA